MKEQKRVEPIVLDFEDGRIYTLEFDRDSVKAAEKAGFKRDQIENNEMTAVSQLFYLSFRKNHPDVKKADAEKILFDDLGGLTEPIVQRLIQLYNAPYETLFNQTGEVKNPKLTVRM